MEIVELTPLPLLRGLIYYLLVPVLYYVLYFLPTGAARDVDLPTCLPANLPAYKPAIRSITLVRRFDTSLHSPGPGPGSQSQSRPWCNSFLPAFKGDIKHKTYRNLADGGES